jgi:hypothetical protein
VQVVGPGGAGTLSGVVAEAAGCGHSLAVKSDGTVWAWGDNASGELGDNSTSDSSTPVQVLGPGGSGTLSGKWDTIVRCNGVLIKVFRDSVIVNDGARHKIVVVHAGHSYLAKR